MTRHYLGWEISPNEIFVIVDFTARETTKTQNPQHMSQDSQEKDG